MWGYKNSMSGIYSTVQKRYKETQSESMETTNLNNVAFHVLAFSQDSRLVLTSLWIEKYMSPVYPIFHIVSTVNS